MYQENNCIEEQSFFLDFNVKDRLVRGHTKLKVKLDKPNLQENVPIVISLCAKQLDVKSIDLIEIFAQKEDQGAAEPIEDKNVIQIKWEYPNILIQVFKDVIFSG